MMNDTNSPSGVGEVVVNATLTDPSTQAQQSQHANVAVQDASLQQEVSRLASELKRMNCLFHEECDAIKHYVDQAIERDRLAKRP